MKKPEKVIVDGNSYTISPYNTSFGVQLLTELASLLGEPLFNLIIQMGIGDAKSAPAARVQKFLDTDIDPKMFTAIFSKLEPDTLDRIFQKTLVDTYSGTVCVAGDYNSRFMGNYKHLLKLVLKTIQVQYSDFLEGPGESASPVRAVLPT